MKIYNKKNFFIGLLLAVYAVVMFLYGLRSGLPPLQLGLPVMWLVLAGNWTFRGLSKKQAQKDILEERDERNRKMCDKLYQAGYPITYEELTARFPIKILTRAHFAKFLYEKEAVGSIDAAFRKILAQDGPYFVMRQYLTPQKGIEIIKKAGGIPVLAHPMLYKLSVSEIRNLLTELKSGGLIGLEVLYSRNQGNDEAFLRKLAQEFDLSITGGTDFHGDNKPDLSIGTGTGNLQIPYSLLEKLQSRR